MSTLVLPPVIQALFPAEALRVGYKFFRKGAQPDPKRAQDFDAQADWWCSQLALLAYIEDDAAVANILREAGLQPTGAPITDNASSDLRVIVASAGDCAYIAVRGTVFPAPGTLDAAAYLAALRSWSLDVQASLVPLGKPLGEFARGRLRGRIHSGFQFGYNHLVDNVRAELAKLPAVSQYFFTGHSLGGALAVLLATTADLPAGSARTAVTFGAPRLGDDLLIESIDVPHCCYVHGSDQVADLPPRPFLPAWLAAGYEDYPERMFLPRLPDSGGGLGNAEKLLAPALPSATTSLAAPAKAFANAALGRVIDHAMILYAEQCALRL